jgi:hypothetical protein
MSFLEKIPRFAGFGGLKYAPHNCVRLFTICVEFYMVSRKLNFLEILKFRQGGGIDVFVKNSIFQKGPKYVFS